MAYTTLTANHVVSGAGLGDPTGVVGVVGGFQFTNDRDTFMRLANAAASASAVATVTLGAATPSGGTYALTIDIFGVSYVTAAIAYGAITSAMATAVLAAVNPLTGNALSTDFPAGTCVGGGTALPTGPATLTFGGAGVTGLATTPIVVTLDSTLTTGGTYAVKMSTPGTGQGRIYIQNPTTGGLPTAVPIPTGTSWYSFTPSTYNSPLLASSGLVSIVFDSAYASYTCTLFHVG